MKVKNDHRGKFPILAIGNIVSRGVPSTNYVGKKPEKSTGKKKPEKIRASR